jgi:hypothetical protein
VGRELPHVHFVLYFGQSAFRHRPYFSRIFSKQLVSIQRIGSQLMMIVSRHLLGLILFIGQSLDNICFRRFRGRIEPGNGGQKG